MNIRKPIAAVVSASLLLNVAVSPDLALATLSKPPSPPVASQLWSARNLPASPSGVPAKSADLPANDLLRALVRDTAAHLNVAQSVPGSGVPVLLIQDVHLNADAQRNIGEALLRIEERMGRRMVVGVEAAEGPFRFEAMRRYPDERVRQSVADFLLRENSIAAASWFGLVSRKLPAVEGADDRALYLRNEAAYKTALPLRRATLAAIERRLAGLEARKPGVLSRDARRLYDGLAGFREGRVPLADHISTLARAGGTDGFAAINAFEKAYALEQKLDTRGAEAERGRLVAELSKAHPRLLESLVRLRLDHGSSSSPAFLRGFATAAAGTGIDFSGYPNFKAFLDYAVLVDAIRHDRLFDELDEAASRAVARASTTPAERRFFEEAEGLRLCAKLARFELTPSEWRSYGRVPPALKPGDMAPFEAFYRTAIARDEALASRVLDAARRHAPGAAVLVCGGFHADGIAGILRSRGVPFAVLAPKFTVTAGHGGDYLGAFVSERTPLEKLFAGEKLTVALANRNLGAARPFPGHDPDLSAARLAAALAVAASLLDGEEREAALAAARDAAAAASNGRVTVESAADGAADLVLNETPVSAGAEPSNEDVDMLENVLPFDSAPNVHLRPRAPSAAGLLRIAASVAFVASAGSLIGAFLFGGAKIVALSGSGAPMAMTGFAVFEASAWPWVGAAAVLFAAGVFAYVLLRTVPPVDREFELYNDLSGDPAAMAKAFLDGRFVSDAAQVGAANVISLASSAALEPLTAERLLASGRVTNHGAMQILRAMAGFPPLALGDLVRPYHDDTIPAPDLAEEEITRLRGSAEELLGVARMTLSNMLAEKRGNKAVEFKLDDSVVTEFDTAIQEAVLRRLRALYPDHFLLGEEKLEIAEEADNQARSTSDYVWVLDPIDGTKGFSDGNNVFGIPLTLFYKGLPVVALVWSPDFGTMERSADRPGTYVNGERVKLPETMPKKITVAITGDTSDRKLLAALLTEEVEAGRLESASVPESGRSAVIALGRMILDRFHFYGHLKNKKGPYLWDWIAMSYLLEGAGGRVVLIDEDGRLMPLLRRYERDVTDPERRRLFPYTHLAGPRAALEALAPVIFRLVTQYQAKRVLANDAEKSGGAKDQTAPDAAPRAIDALIERHVPAERRKGFARAILPAADHSGRPTLRDHLRAMLDVLSDPDSRSRVPAEVRAGLESDPLFHQLYILYHRISMISMPPTTVIEKGRNYSIYPDFERESFDMMRNDPRFAEELPEARREILLQLIRFQRLPHEKTFTAGDVEAMVSLLPPGIAPVDFVRMSMSAWMLDAAATGDAARARIEAYVHAARAWMLNRNYGSLSVTLAMATPGRDLFTNSGRLRELAAMFSGNPPRPVETDIYALSIDREEFPAEFVAFLSGLLQNWMMIVSDPANPESAQSNPHYQVGEAAYHVNVSVIQNAAAPGVSPGVLGSQDEALTRDELSRIFGGILEVMRQARDFELVPVGVRAGSDGGLIFVFEYAEELAKIRDGVAVRGAEAPKPSVHLTLFRARRGFQPTEAQVEFIKRFVRRYADVREELRRVGMPPIRVRRVTFAHETRWMHEQFDLRIPLELGGENADAAARLEEHLSRRDRIHRAGGAPYSMVIWFWTVVAHQFGLSASPREIARRWSPIVEEVVFSLLIIGIPTAVVGLISNSLAATAVAAAALVGLRIVLFVLAHPTVLRPASMSLFPIADPLLETAPNGHPFKTVVFSTLLPSGDELILRAVVPAGGSAPEGPIEVQLLGLVEKNTSFVPLDHYAAATPESDAAAGELIERLHYTFPGLRLDRKSVDMDISVEAGEYDPVTGSLRARVDVSGTVVDSRRTADTLWLALVGGVSGGLYAAGLLAAFGFLPVWLFVVSLVLLLPVPVSAHAGFQRLAEILNDRGHNLPYATMQFGESAKSVALETMLALRNRHIPDQSGLAIAALYLSVLPPNVDHEPWEKELFRAMVRNVGALSSDGVSDLLRAYRRLSTLLPQNDEEAFWHGIFKRMDAPLTSDDRDIIRFELLRVFEDFRTGAILPPARWYEPLLSLSKAEGFDLDGSTARDEQERIEDRRAAADLIVSAPVAATADDYESAAFYLSTHSSDPDFSDREEKLLAALVHRLPDLPAAARGELFEALVRRNGSLSESILDEVGGFLESLQAGGQPGEVLYSPVPSNGHRTVLAEGRQLIEALRLMYEKLLKGENSQLRLPLSLAITRLTRPTDVPALDERGLNELHESMGRQGREAEERARAREEARNGEPVEAETAFIDLPNDPAGADPAAERIRLLDAVTIVERLIYQIWNGTGSLDMSVVARLPRSIENAVREAGGQPGAELLAILARISALSQDQLSVSSNGALVPVFGRLRELVAGLAAERFGEERVARTQAAGAASAAKWFVIAFAAVTPLLMGASGGSATAFVVFVVAFTLLLGAASLRQWTRRRQELPERMDEPGDSEAARAYLADRIADGLGSALASGELAPHVYAVAASIGLGGDRLQAFGLSRWKDVSPSLLGRQSLEPVRSNGGDALLASALFVVNDAGLARLYVDLARRHRAGLLTPKTSARAVSAIARLAARTFALGAPRLASDRELDRRALAVSLYGLARGVGASERMDVRYFEGLIEKAEEAAPASVNWTEPSDLKADSGVYVYYSGLEFLDPAFAESAVARDENPGADRILRRLAGQFREAASGRLGGVVISAPAARRTEIISTLAAWLREDGVDAAVIARTVIFDHSERPSVFRAWAGLLASDTPVRAVRGVRLSDGQRTLTDWEDNLETYQALLRAGASPEAIAELVIEIINVRTGLSLDVGTSTLREMRAVIRALIAA